MLSGHTEQGYICYATFLSQSWQHTAVTPSIIPHLEPKKPKPPFVNSKGESQALFLHPRT